MGIIVTVSVMVLGFVLWTRFTETGRTAWPKRHHEATVAQNEKNHDFNQAVPATFEYQVQLLAPTPSATGRAWMYSTILLPISWGDPIPPTVRVQIVEVGTGAVLARWTMFPEDAQGLKAKIETDLNQLDVATFADEWGLHPRSSHSDPN